MNNNHQQLTEDERDTLFEYGLQVGDLAERLYAESVELLKNNYPYQSLACYLMAQRTHLRSVELMELSIT